MTAGWGPVVYRVYDKDDRLIYIGSTQDIEERVRFHWYASWWMGIARRFDLEDHPNPDAAHEAETRAIVQESPAFNVNSSGRPQFRWTPVPLTDDDQSALRAWAAMNPNYTDRLPRAFRWALDVPTRSAA